MISSWPHVTEVTVASFVVHSDLRPFVGVAPDSAAQELLGFLRQQGYVVEISLERGVLLGLLRLGQLRPGNARVPGHTDG